MAAIVRHASNGRCAEIHGAGRQEKEYGWAIRPAGLVERVRVGGKSGRIMERPPRKTSDEAHLFELA